jgi:hypothetical protein
MGVPNQQNIAEIYESQNFVWTGKTKFIIKNLQPNEKRVFVLKASIYESGTYNLNRFKIVNITPCRQKIIGESEENKSN